MKQFVLFGLLTLTTQYLLAQKVCSVDYKNQADVSVFVVDYANQADLKVFKVDYSNQADGNKGLWFFTDYENQSDKKIFFVDYANQAGWQSNSKKYLLY